MRVTPASWPGKKARQLICRHQEINRGNNEQNDAEQGQYQLHDASSLNSIKFCTSFRGASQRVRPPLLLLDVGAIDRGR